MWTAVHCIWPTVHMSSIFLLMSRNLVPDVDRRSLYMTDGPHVHIRQEPDFKIRHAGCGPPSYKLMWTAVHCIRVAGCGPSRSAGFGAGYIRPTHHAAMYSRRREVQENCTCCEMYHYICRHHWVCNRLCSSQVKWYIVLQKINKLKHSCERALLGGCWVR